MRRYAMFVFALLVCLIGLTQKGHTQEMCPCPSPTKTPSGFYYPIATTGGILQGYHRVGGLKSDPNSPWTMVPGANGFAGHFMSPDSSKTDFHTKALGRYGPLGVYHNGMDLMSDYGTRVYAVTDGFVDNQNTFTTDSWSSSGGCSPACTTNTALVLTHFTGMGQAFKAVYGHIEKSTIDPVLLSKGAFVSAGQYLGRIGSWNNGNHLHFGIYAGIGDAPVNGTTTGWGRDAISFWPSRLDWADPVMFIESQCPTSVVCYPNKISDFVAESDMKEQLIGKFKPTAFTWDGYFGYWFTDQYWVYRYQWFYNMENGQPHWYFAEHITLTNDSSIRYITYQDYSTLVWSPWFQVVVIK